MIDRFELKPEENNGNLILFNRKSEAGLIIPKGARIIIEFEQPTLQELGDELKEDVLSPELSIGDGNFE